MFRKHNSTLSKHSSASAGNPLYENPQTKQEGIHGFISLPSPTNIFWLSRRKLAFIVAAVAAVFLLTGLGIGKAAFSPLADATNDLTQLPTDLSIVNINANLLVNVGQTVTVNGIVVWDGRRTSARGFYLQTKLGSTNPGLGASEAIFVKCSTGSSLCTSTTIDEGFEVTVTGNVTSAADRGDTIIRPQISQSDIRKVVINCNTPTVNVLPNGPKFCAKVRLRQIVFPLPDDIDAALLPGLGMLVDIVEPQRNVMTVTGTSRLAQFGELVLSSDGLLPFPTMAADPGPAAQQVDNVNAHKQIWLDDASFNTNQRPTLFPLGGLQDNDEHQLRAGFVLPTSALTGLTVLDRRTVAWHLQPNRWGMQQIPQSFVAPPGTERQNGDVVAQSKGVKPNNLNSAYLRIASMNIENFFVDPVRNNSCPLFDCRGAQTRQQYQIQSTKVYEAISEVLPAILVVQEMENDAASVAIKQFVTELNAYIFTRTGLNASYSFVNSGKFGPDVTRPAILFDPRLVDPVGPFKILPYFKSGSRPSLLQTFQPKCSQNNFTVVAMHLKSRLPLGCDAESDCEADNPFGEGAFARKRANHSAAIRDFIATDPTGSMSDKFILLGDFNANRKERAVTTLTKAGYVDLASRDELELPHSFQFDGTFSTLDYALASPPMAAICRAAEWHTNSVESEMMGFLDQGAEGSPFRASDHDPLIVGCDFSGGCTSSPTPPVTNTPTITGAPTTAPGSPSTAKWKAFVNEFHADTIGTDLPDEEFVEIAVSKAATADLTKITVQLVNGANGAPYFTAPLSIFTRGATICPGDPEQETILFFRRIAGIQNGPDSIAVAVDTVLQDHISYPDQAKFVPVSGIATGDISTPIGVGSEVAGGSSVSRTGTGKASLFGTTFAWSSPVQATPGAINVGQTFTCSGSG